MGDRAQCSIEIGGTLPASLLDEFANHVASYDLRTDWSGEPYDPQTYPEGEKLNLFGEELNGGLVDTLEQFCKTNALQFRRWSGGCPGAFHPELVVYYGPNDEYEITATEDEHPVLTLQEISRFETIQDIKDFVARFTREIPTFTVVP
jgi:hypothetical protein